MINIMLSKIKTPINLLMGVIFCILLIDNISVYGKNFIVLMIIIIKHASAKLYVRILFSSWYRFSYLLFVTTLDKVKKLKQDIDMKSVKITEAIQAVKFFEQIASRLAIYIQIFENIESEQT